MTIQATLAPNSPEAEESVLGAILIDPDIFYDVSAILSPRHFFSVKNGWIFQAILDLSEKGLEIDNLTVVDELARRGQLKDTGGSAYISFLINQTPTSQHAITYAKIVLAAYKRRALLDAAGKIAEVSLSEEENIDTCLEEAYGILDRAVSSSPSGGLISFKQVDALSEALAWKADPQEVRDVKLGIPPLDRLLTGVNSIGTYLTILAPTHGGKSTLAAQMLLSIAEQAKERDSVVLFFPTETDVMTMKHKLVCQLLGENYRHLRTGKTRHDAFDLKAMYDYIDSLPILVCDESSPTPARVLSEYRKTAKRQNVLALIMDSINHMGRGGEIYERTSLAADTLMDISRRCLVIATAQVNRSLKDRKEKSPQIGDTQGGGIPEQNSTHIISIDWPNYFVRTKQVPETHEYARVPANEVYLRVLKDKTSGAAGGHVKVIYVPGRGFYPESDQKE